MPRKIITVILLCAIVNIVIGCYTSRIVSVTNVSSTSLTKEKIVQVTLTDGTVIKFYKNGAIYKDKDEGLQQVVVGTDDNGNRSIIEINKILEVRVERTEHSTGGTILTVIGIVAGIALIVIIIILITKQSCPFIYSYDGEKYVFDAEPLGGATTAGLKRTDYSRLENLKAFDNKYQLMIRNEADETQHTDEMKLVIIDHTPGTTITPDYNCALTAFSHITAPISVTDENGRSLLNFFQAKDDIKWQSQLPIDSSFRDKDLRHHLTFKFPIEKNKKTVKLLVNAGTALWGSNMIKEMLKLRGNKVDEWYKDIDRQGPELMKLHYFMAREELYVLKINVLEGSLWAPRGLINGGGPLIDEDRIISLDIQKVVGDTLTLQLNPPLGYWKIDYIGLLEDENPVPSIKEISATQAIDQNGTDISGLLNFTDNNYYSMPKTGDWAKLSFDVPSQDAGIIRTIYLKTSGYYEIHLPKDTPEQTDLLTEIGLIPGKIVEYSMDLYLKWNKQQISRNN